MSQSVFARISVIAPRFRECCVCATKEILRERGGKGEGSFGDIGQWRSNNRMSNSLIVH